jgi:hypothetical protein
MEEWEKTYKEDLLDILVSLRDADNNALLTKQEIKSIILACMHTSFPSPFSYLGIDHSIRVMRIRRNLLFIR